MSTNITNIKVAIAFLIGVCLIFFSGLFVSIKWLFVTSVLIGIILTLCTMGYFVYHVVNFVYNKMNEK